MSIRFSFSARPAAWVVLMLVPLVIFLWGVNPRTARAEPWSERTKAQAAKMAGAIVAPPYARAGATPKGLSVAVGKDGVLLYAEGFGEARPGIAASASTIYRIGSISKQFLAATLLNAMDESALVLADGQPVGLDTKLADVFSETAVWNRSGIAPITVRSLLTMTSSLPNFTRKPPPELDPWGAVEADHLRNALSRLQRGSAQGSFEYTNTGYFLLSEIARATSRGARSYRQLVHEFAITKAQLSTTGFALDPAFAGRLALPGYKRRPAFVEPDWLQGSADMASSVLDLFAWNAALMEGRVLAPHVRDIMWGDAARVDVWTYYAMGWFATHKDGLDTYFHSGSVPGYTGFNALAKDAAGSWISVSILTNSDGVEGLDGLADDLLELAQARVDAQARKLTND